MSNNYQIGVIVGSLRADSYNKQVANALMKIFPGEFSLRLIEIGELPLYNQDSDQQVPANVASFKSEIAKCDGIIFVTPEYNRSIPGVLKNAIDQGSRPWGDNSWSHKPAGVLGVSIGNISTAIAQQHLRNSLAFLDMPTLNQPECFLKWFDGMIEPDGRFSEKSLSFMQKWVDAYTQLISHHVVKS